MVTHLRLNSPIRLINVSYATYKRVKHGFDRVSEFGGRDKSRPYEKNVLG